MTVTVHFHSYFKELTGCEQTVEKTMPPGSALGDLYEHLIHLYPKLGPVRKSTLLAVGVEYQPRSYILKDGDEVSLFPPVQGG